jgi:RHS repeat-associated protein
MYAYSSTDHVHAVTSVTRTNGQNTVTDTFTYDANGNMTCRFEGGKYYNQEYNVENRLWQVTLRNNSCSGTVSATWTFTYDGDGTRVKQVYTAGTSTLTTYYFAGGLYEVRNNGTTTTTIKYYAFGGQTIMNDGSGLKYFLTDHLGSVVAVTDASGNIVQQQRYLPFGQVRSDAGTITQTDMGFTFQRNLDAQGASFSLGLLDYKARFYSSLTGRFVQPDTITPGGPQGLNRYSYSNNNPINYTDPSGHCTRARYSTRVITDDECEEQPGGVKYSEGGDSELSLDPVRLTTGCEIQWGSYCSSGERMKKLYEWYSIHPGQWNNYGKSIFTIQAFYAWIVYIELGYTFATEGALDYAKKLAAEKTMQLCAQYSYSSSCTYISNNAAFNYLATRASAEFRYRLMSSGKNPDPVFPNKPSAGDWYSYNMSGAAEIAAYVFGYTGSGSYADWGNESMFSNTATLAALSVATPGQGSNQYLMMFSRGDPLYFFSSNQNIYWHCLNSNNGNQEAC